MRLVLLAALSCSLLVGAPAAAQDRVIEVAYLPTGRAQIAIWIERADGTFLRTLRLTQAVAVRGIGNRPGASQMNSGFRWPYGRRENVLPVWAHRRASAPGAQLFPRVIFQDRASEGFASRTSQDFSRDDYFCLSFARERSSREALDAVTCASVFHSDKGRYLTEEDVARGYGEPVDMGDGVTRMRPLEAFSLYPPRRDVTRCISPGCYDHPDVDRYAADARRVMPEIDVATMATPPAATLQRHLFTVPADWPDGDYVVWIEVNVEGDYNERWALPTPRNPEPGPDYHEYWDYWAMNYGYPYRGQPSVVYRVPFRLGAGAFVVQRDRPDGYGSIDGFGPGASAMSPMDGSISDDPIGAPGSGADRLMRTAEGWRVQVRTQVCVESAPPGPIEGLEVRPYHDRADAHRFAHLSFVAPEDDAGIAAYEVRVATSPIVDEATFLRALPAMAATTDTMALEVPTDAAPGDLVEVDIGGLVPETRHWVAVRALDACNQAGSIAVVEYTTPPIRFTTVSPCFVATAAYGTPMADDIAVLRRLRDRHLRSNAPGRALVALYDALGPALADAIRERPAARAAVRAILAPLIALARGLV